MVGKRERLVEDGDLGVSEETTLEAVEIDVK
jgi:hypothetical protein